MDIGEIERAAEKRIREHRTAEFRPRLRDAAGARLSRARATVRLRSHEFRLGANGFLIRGAGLGDCPPGTMADDGLLIEYERAFADFLNYATLPFYWGGYEPEPGRENADRLERMAAWCLEHSVKAKGHPLAWHQVFPKWVEPLPDEEALRRLRDRISRLVGAFRGKVDTWDVFNEATVASRFDNAVGRWVKANGVTGCVADALRLARAANPEAELLYNDFNVSPALEDLVGQLRKRGVSFNAIGIQSYMHKGAWTPEKTWQTCETYARFGLPLHFTKVTILSGRLKTREDNEWHRQHTDWNSTPDGEERQLEEGRRFYTLLFSHPAVEAVTWWDFSDLKAWQGAPAGLMRNDMSPKPLADWIRAAFKERWSTKVTGAANAEGVVTFRSFFGSFTVRAETDRGVCLFGSCRLSRRGSREADVILAPG